MQDIYTYIPETNYVPREYSVTAILSLLFTVLISLVPVLNQLLLLLLLLLVVVVVIVVYNYKSLQYNTGFFCCSELLVRICIP